MLIWIITGTGLALTSLVLLLGGLWHLFRLVCNNERRRLVADTARAVVAEVEARDARRARAARGTRQVPGGSRDTQQRSDEVQDEIRRFLHEEKGLGEIQYVRANRYGLREAVAKTPGGGEGTSAKTM